MSVMKVRLVRTLHYGVFDDADVRLLDIVHDIDEAGEFCWSIRREGVEVDRHRNFFSAKKVAMRMADNIRRKS